MNTLSTNPQDYGKPIMIEGENYYYKIFYSYDDYYQIDYRTVFFREVEIKPEWKYFWQKRKYYVYRVTLFQVNVDIEDVSYTKEEMREKVMKAFQLHRRADEIKNGQII